jgi:hypothetical protein
MRKVPLLVVLVVLWSGLASAQFVAPGAVVPVVANLPGVNDTYWRSDVNILNVGPADTSVVLQLFPEIVDGEPAFEPRTSAPLTIPAGGQRTLANVVQSQFQLFNVKGALSIFSTDGSPLVVSSRTYTPASVGGTYGQDVSSVLVSGSAWASGVQHDGFYRTNVGIFWLWDQDVDFTVTVLSAAGDVVGSGTVSFSAAGLQQLSLDRFGVDTLLDGYVVFECDDIEAIWYAYASRVDQSSGDAVFRLARGYQLGR